MVFLKDDASFELYIQIIELKYYLQKKYKIEVMIAFDRFYSERGSVSRSR